MTKKKMKIMGMTAAILGSAGMTATGMSEDDLLQDAGSWLGFYGEGRLKFVDPSLEKGRIWVEGQSRWVNDWNHWNQGVVRAAVGYSLSDRATIWAGYTWVPTQNLGQPYKSQQDAWPAFRYVLPTSLGTVTFRTMLESNFIPGNGNTVRVHPRQMVRFVHPLQFEPRLSLVTWNEIHLRINTTPQAANPASIKTARLRASAGPSIKTSGAKPGISISIWTMLRIPIIQCAI